MKLTSIVTFLLLLSCTTSSLHANDFTSGSGPEIINAIPDQELLFESSLSTSTRVDSAASYFIRDLSDSFSTEEANTYSVFVYNDEIANAWLIEDLLLIQAKNLGTSHIAVTAENKNGSSIDWFVLNVKEPTKRQITANQASSYSQIYVDSYGWVSSILPSFAGETTVYFFVPDTLPKGLNFNAEEMLLEGKVASNYTYSTVTLLGRGQDNSLSTHTVFLRSQVHSATTQAGLGLDDQLYNALTNLDLDVSKQPLEQDESPNSYIYRGIRYDIQFSREASQQPVGLPELFSDMLSELSLTMHNQTSQSNLLLGESASTSNQTQLWSSFTTLDTSQSNIRSNLIGLETQTSPTLQTGISLGVYSTENSRSDEHAHGLSLLPYWRWQSSSGRLLWGMVGFGVSSPSEDNPIDSSLMGAVGWRQPIGTPGTFELASIGDVGFALPMTLDSELQNSDFSIFDQTSKSVRAGVEVAYNHHSRIRPYIGLSGNLNSFEDSRTTGVETRGGLRISDLLGVAIEAEGRAFNTLNEVDPLLWGVSLAAKIDPGVSGQGLAITFAPSYGLGNQASTSNFRWIDSTPNSIDYLEADRSWAMSGALSYGMPLLRKATITPFGQMSISTLNKTRMGLRVSTNSTVNRGLDVEVASIRYLEDDKKLINQGIDIQLRLLF